MNTETGVIYFRLNERYDGDTTKNCSLTSGEIDKNFHFLRGSDIVSGAWYPENGGRLELKRVDDTVITISGVSFSQGISLEGSEFLTESGGCLSLVVNGGEPYYVTGMTEIFEEFIETLSGITGQTDTSITSDIDEIIAVLDEFDERFIIIDRILSTDIPQRFSDLEERLGDRIDALCNTLNTEIAERKRVDEDLRNDITKNQKDIRLLSTRIDDNARYNTENFNRLTHNIENIERVITAIQDSIEQLREGIDGKIEAEILDRKEANTNIRESIRHESERISEASGRIIQEEITRAQQDAELQAQITHNANKNSEIASNLSNVQRDVAEERAQRQESDADLRSAIINVRNAVYNEEHKRYADVSRLMADYLSRINYTNEQIELVKDYANSIYFDDPSNPEDCDNIKWGVRIIPDIQTGKKRIVLNLNPDDDFLSQCNRYLSSTISLRYNDQNNHIELIGRKGTPVSYIDANVFIQKGFLKGATVENRIVHDVEEPCLVLTWDTGEGGTSETVIPAADLFTEYTQGDGIEIDNRIISVAIGNGEPFLKFENGELFTNNIEATIKRIASAVLNSAIEDSTSALNILIGSEIERLKTEIEELLGEKVNIADFTQYRDITNTAISGIQQDVVVLSQEIDLCQKNISGLTDNVSGLTVSVYNLDSDVDGLNERMGAAEQKMGAMESKIEELEEEIEQGGGISEDILEKLDESGVTTQPSASITLMVQENGQTARTARACEVGTVITISSLTTGFTTGNYQYGPRPTGVEATGSVITFENNGQTFSEETFTVTDNTNVRAKISVTHTSGVTAETKLGRKDNNPTHTIQAGTKTTYSTVVSGFRYSFYKSIATIADVFTENFIKESANNATGNSFNLAISPNDKEVIIAIPASKNLVKVLDANFNDTDISPNFLMTTCQVGGYNGADKISYKVYYYIPDVPFSLNNTYKITIV